MSKAIVIQKVNKIKCKDTREKLLKDIEAKYNNKIIKK